MRAGTCTVAALAALAFGACGGEGEREDVERAIRGYLAAVAERDAERACAHLTRNAQLGVFEFRRVHAAPDHPGEACADVVERHAPRSGVARLRDPSIEDVEVDGDRARARVDGFPVELERERERWKIAIFGLAGDVSGEVRIE